MKKLPNEIILYILKIKWYTARKQRLEKILQFPTLEHEFRGVEYAYNLPFYTQLTEIPYHRVTYKISMGKRVGKRVMIWRLNVIRKTMTIIYQNGLGSRKITYMPEYVISW